MDREPEGRKGHLNAPCSLNVTCGCLSGLHWSWISSLFPAQLMTEGCRGLNLNWTNTNCHPTPLHHHHYHVWVQVEMMLQRGITCRKQLTVKVLDWKFDLSEKEDPPPLIRYQTELGVSSSLRPRPAAVRGAEAADGFVISQSLLSLSPWINCLLEILNSILHFSIIQYRLVYCTAACILDRVAQLYYKYIRMI